MSTNLCTVAPQFALGAQHGSGTPVHDGVNDMTDHDDLRLAGTEAFEAVASALFAPLRVTHPCPQEFKAVVGHSAIRPVVVTRIKATTATVTRDHHSTASSDVEWMHFTLHHHGPLTAIQDDRTTTVKPGELFACDNTRPYRLIGTNPTDMTVLCVPRASLGRHANSISQRTALPICPQGGISSLYGHTLSAITEDLPRHGVARVYLADSQLSAETVAHQHRISVRHLHTLFKGRDLTFAAWVRHERLLRIRRDLLAPPPQTSPRPPSQHDGAYTTPNISAGPSTRVRRLVTLTRLKAPRVAERLVDEIFTTLDEQTVVVPGTDAAALIVPSLAAFLQAVLDQRKIIATRIEELLANHALSKVLTSMPGIGVRTGARILIDVGDSSSFPSAAHLASYTGASPRPPAARDPRSAENNPPDAATSNSRERSSSPRSPPWPTPPPARTTTRRSTRASTTPKHFSASPDDEPTCSSPCRDGTFYEPQSAAADGV